MYPILSPSKIKLEIEFFEKGKIIRSENFFMKSPSNDYLDIDINNLVKKNNLKNISAFQVRTKAVNGKIPTRVNHQLVYGSNTKDALLGSINSSLTNNEIMIPKRQKRICLGPNSNRKRI